MVGNADDVARKGLVRELAVLREKEDRGMHRDRLAAAARRQLHAPPELARTKPHEGDPVALLRVHIDLDLEDEAGDLGVLRLYRRGLGRRAAGGRRAGGSRVDQLGEPQHRVGWTHGLVVKGWVSE